MAPGRRLGGGCWTCRLRRKRCDAARPVCGSCRELGIICHISQTRPSWMDGGSGQKHMSERIKEGIRQNAFLKRELRLLGREDQTIVVAAEIDFTSLTDAVLPTLNPYTADIAANHSPPDSIPPAPLTNSTDHTTSWSSTESFDRFQSPSTASSLPSVPIALTSSWPSTSPWPVGPAVPIQVQLGSVMIYLDYVFPFLFPFYQPPLLETGRQWLLGLLCQSEVSFHMAASLSAYFFSLIPQTDGRDMHEDCRTLVRARLVEQMDAAVRSLQNAVSAISGHTSQSSLLDKVRVMEEITQLLIVEVTVRRNVDWKIHLTPALAILDDIFKGPSTEPDRPKPDLATILSALPLPVMMTTPTPHKPLPNTADQSALVFFVSLLLFIDIIASTSLATPPVLQNHHHRLLPPSPSPSSTNNHIRLETVIGCQNWPLLAIGQTSALCAWKRLSKQKGDFSVVDLVNHAHPILQSLDRGLKSLSSLPNPQSPSPNTSHKLEAYYTHHDTPDPSTVTTTTRIWAHAAKLYLSVSLSGYRTNSPQTQTDITQILGLLSTITSPARLRSLSWPICIAGCLATGAQEEEFRSVVRKIDPSREFGTAGDALNVMEMVWRERDEAGFDADGWGFCKGLNVKGRPVLLV